MVYYNKTTTSMLLPSLFPLFSLSSLSLFSSVFAEKYIVISTSPVLNLQNDQNSQHGYSNTQDSLRIGDMTFHFTESSEPPQYNDRDVVHVELDSPVHVASTGSESLYNLQENPVWNLDRVDQRSPNLNKKYFSHSSGGRNVNNYVLDTGIFIDHPEFESRARWGANFADNQGPDGCLESHGTHVAGVIGSKTFGMAKKTNLISVKVLDCQGSGSTSSVIRGIEYAMQDNVTGPKIINMSLGGGLSIALNKAVREATKAGIFVVAAAGNENSDACNTSPASEHSAITVGAFEKGDKISYFSNWGSCVDIFAPGSRIESTVPGGGSEVFDGTSQATPLVAGVISLMLSSSSRGASSTPREMKEFLSMTSTKNSLSGNLRGSPNKIVFSLSYMM